MRFTPDTREKKNKQTTHDDSSKKTTRGLLLMVETLCPCLCASDSPDRQTDPQHAVGDHSTHGWVEHSPLPAPPLGPLLIQRL